MVDSSNLDTFLFFRRREPSCSSPVVPASTRITFSKQRRTIQLHPDAASVSDARSRQRAQKCCCWSTSSTHNFFQSVSSSRRDGRSRKHRAVLDRVQVDDDVAILYLLPEGVSRWSGRSIGGKQFIESKKSASDVVGRVPRVSTRFSPTPDAIEIAAAAGHPRRTRPVLPSARSHPRRHLHLLEEILVPSRTILIAEAHTARWQISPSASSSHHLQGLYLST